jgi:hypothetical protein
MPLEGDEVEYGRPLIEDDGLSKSIILSFIALHVKALSTCLQDACLTLGNASGAGWLATSHSVSDHLRPH